MSLLIKLRKWAPLIALLPISSTLLYSQSERLAPSARQGRNVGISSTSNLSSARKPPEENAPIQLGPVLFQPGINYRFTSGSGLHSRPGEDLDSDISEATLSLDFVMSENLEIVFTPSWTAYTNDAFDDSFDLSFNLNGNTALGEWQLGFNQTYDEGSSPLIETARQTKQETSGTTLTASRALGGKWYLDLSGEQDLRNSGSFTDTKEWSILNWLRYQANASLDYSFGIGYGYLDIDPGTNFEYTNFMGRIGFRPTEKLNLNLQIGRDHRNADIPGAKSLNNPNYSVQIDYFPTETTSLSIESSRQFSASYFSDQLTENEQFSVDLRQRLLGKFFLSLSAGWNDSQYSLFDGSTEMQRKDSYESYNAELSATLLNRISVSIFYRKNENDSSDDDFGFSSKQSGISLGYRY